MNPYVVAIEGIDSVKMFDELDTKTADNIVRAVNAAVDRAKTRVDRDIRDNLNFSKSYLATRLTVVKRATRGSPEAVIRGSDRPTSLASRTFLKSRPNKRHGPIVEVTPGDSKEIAKGFLIQLSSNFEGLAVRLKPGETLRNKKHLKRLNGNLYLLFGPSVNQAFRMVAEDRVDEIADYLENEFNRLMDVDL